MSGPSNPRAFSRVLVANRGEIAIRIFRTLRDLDIRSIAIYSDADRDADHVRFADEAWCIGGTQPADSYLRIDAVLDAATSAKADAIHPGYGFLAENAEFARACERAGIVFIGPPASAIDAMGSKTASRALMQAAGVPIVPGSTEPVDTIEAARIAADEIGYPVAVKARSGGGGKGFRTAASPDELPAAFDGARGEGARYFSDDAVYLERYLPDPRHVEVQLLADTHGNVIHLGERDCSIQRRHQKLVEECPGPHVERDSAHEIRAKLGKIAVDAARAVGYTSAGTIECLLGPGDEPFFLEMNTRVQVEHTVTEAVTGVDIVAEQIRIAEGHRLALTQDEVTFTGYAVECRINAEQAEADFRPSSGTITRFDHPAGPGVRIDAGYSTGSVVSPFYDTLLAKLVTYGADRPSAIARMRRALGELRVDGVDTLIDIHQAIMASDEFARGETCRHIIADPAGAIADWRSSSHATHERRASTGATPARSVAHPDALLVEVDGHRFDVVVHDPHTSLADAPTVRSRNSAQSAGSDGMITAPIPGNVLQVAVTPGQQVAAGDVVVILEAMKMENEIAAPTDGIVDDVAVDAGDAVASGQALVTISPA